MIPDPAIASFEKLLEGTASPEQRERLYRVKDMLQADPDDAIWLIAVALQYHLALYEEIPNKITLSEAKALESYNQKIAEYFDLELRRSRNQLREYSKELVNEIIAQASSKLVGQLDSDLTRLANQFELTHSRKAVAMSRLAHWSFLVFFWLAATTFTAIILAAFPQVVYGLRELLCLSG